jgi:hypothetical protein
MFSFCLREHYFCPTLARRLDLAKSLKSPTASIVCSRAEACVWSIVRKLRGQNSVAKDHRIVTSTHLGLHELDTAHLKI